MQRNVARWRIDHDRPKTTQCYAQLPIGTGCDCNQCRNFDAAPGRTFPFEFTKLLETFCIDPIKPVELCHYCRESSDDYLTGGWFHLVGWIVSGEDVMFWANNSGTMRFEKLVCGVEFGFSTQLSLVREFFDGQSLLQLEFQTRVPWVLAEPEP
jgi:hypothetical protein